MDGNILVHDNGRGLGSHGELRSRPYPRKLRELEGWNRGARRKIEETRYLKDAKNNDYCKVARQSSMLDEATESAGSEYGKYLAVVSVQAALSCGRKAVGVQCQATSCAQPYSHHVLFQASQCLIGGCWQH